MSMSYSQLETFASLVKALGEDASQILTNLTSDDIKLLIARSKRSFNTLPPSLYKVSHASPASRQLLQDHTTSTPSSYPTPHPTGNYTSEGLFGTHDPISNFFLTCVVLASLGCTFLGCWLTHHKQREPSTQYNVGKEAKSGSKKVQLFIYSPRINLFQHCNNFTIRILPPQRCPQKNIGGTTGLRKIILE